MHTMHGESESISKETVELERIRLKELTKSYHPEDIYNADETALFFQLGPKKTLATSTTNGTKTSKARTTVMLISNSSGTDKCRPLVISKA